MSKARQGTTTATINSNLDMNVLEGPEVDDEHDVAPEVSEHLGDHGEGSLERFGEAVLVLVHDEEGIDLFHLNSV